MEGRTSNVWVITTLSSSFELFSGLKQGDAMLSLLFKIVLEKAVRTVEIKIELLKKAGPKLLLAFADDIDLIRHSSLIVRHFQQDRKNNRKGGAESQ